MASITAVPTDDPLSNDYDGMPIDVIVNQFSIMPSAMDCPATYTCVGVTRADGEPSALDCSDWTFDGLFDTMGMDGLLSLTASQEDYDTDSKPPGVYLVEIQAVVDDNPAIMDSTMISFTLNEICDTLAITFEPAVTPDPYTITEPNYMLTIPTPMVTPTECATKYPAQVSYSVDDPDLQAALSDANGVITIDQQDLTLLASSFDGRVDPLTFTAAVVQPDGTLVMET